MTTVVWCTVKTVVSVKNEILEATDTIGNVSTDSNSSGVDVVFLRSVGAPGCVVRMSGAPPDITLDELNELFEQYGGLVETSVRMHYDADNKPTGDCVLATRTPTAANNVIQNVNGIMLRDGHRVKIELAE